MSRSFETLEIWKRSRALTIEIYKLTALFPDNEKFGLISQIRRAVVSVETNIAEGSGRESDKDFAHFLTIAKGSLSEVRSLLSLSVDLRILAGSNGRELIRETEEIQRMIFSFRSHLTPHTSHLTEAS